jgi:hypothetical protein
LPKIRVMHEGPREDRIVETSAAEGGVEQTRIGEERVTEISILELGSAQVGTLEVGTFEDRVAEIGHRQIAVPEVCPP